MINSEYVCWHVAGFHLFVIAVYQTLSPVSSFASEQTQTSPLKRVDFLHSFLPLGNLASLPFLSVKLGRETVLASLSLCPPHTHELWSQHPLTFALIKLASTGSATLSIVLHSGWGDTSPQQPASLLFLSRWPHLFLQWWYPALCISSELYLHDTSQVLRLRPIVASTAGWQHLYKMLASLSLSTK